MLQLGVALFAGGDGCAVVVAGLWGIYQVDKAGDGVRGNGRKCYRGQTQGEHKAMDAGRRGLLCATKGRRKAVYCEWYLSMEALNCSMSRNTRSAS
jgi:hypothetical protein